MATTVQEVVSTLKLLEGINQKHVVERLDILVDRRLFEEASEIGDKISLLLQKLENLPDESSN